MADGGERGGGGGTCMPRIEGGIIEGGMLEEGLSNPACTGDCLGGGASGAACLMAPGGERERAGWAARARGGGGPV